LNFQEKELSSFSFVLLFSKVYFKFLVLKISFLILLTYKFLSFKFIFYSTGFCKRVFFKREFVVFWSPKDCSIIVTLPLD